MFTKDIPRACTFAARRTSRLVRSLAGFALSAALLWAAPTGITNFGGSAVIAVNHLGLGWNTPAVNQITAWLSAP